MQPITFKLISKNLLIEPRLLKITKVANCAQVLAARAKIEFFSFGTVRSWTSNWILKHDITTTKNSRAHNFKARAYSADLLLLQNLEKIY